MRMDSVPIPLPAALVDTSFSLIQVGLKTLVLSTVIDKVEAPVWTAQTRINGCVVSDPERPVWQASGHFPEDCPGEHKIPFPGNHRSIGHLDLDIQTDAMVFCFICIKSENGVDCIAVAVNMVRMGRKLFSHIPPDRISDPLNLHASHNPGSPADADGNRDVPGGFLQFWPAAWNTGHAGSAKDVP